jgi:hypothetical protein
MRSTPFLSIPKPSRVPSPNSGERTQRTVQASCARKPHHFHAHFLTRPPTRHTEPSHRVGGARRGQATSFGNCQSVQKREARSAGPTPSLTELRTTHHALWHGIMTRRCVYASDGIHVRMSAAAPDCLKYCPGKRRRTYFRVVEGVQGTLGVDHVVKVNVRIAKRAAGHGVAANSDGRDRTDVTARNNGTMRPHHVSAWAHPTA